MFITAQRIHNGVSWLPEGTVIEVSGDGTIVGVGKEPHCETVHYEGVLVPGFVNVHCHLELSHMKGVVPEHTGLVPFLMQIPKLRNEFTEQQKAIARHAAFDAMLDNGIVAVGDISNTADTIDLRSQDKMHFYTFVEALGFSDAHASGSFAYALGVYEQLAAQSNGERILRQSMVPHAPYSVSSSLFRLIDAQGSSPLISIHNQESKEEDIFYKNGGGRVPDLLDMFNIDHSSFTPSGKSSLQTYLPWMSTRHPIVFVHNTCTQREDVQFAHQYLTKAYWCLCPNANKYIEDKLPDIDMFIGEGANICVGTDSLSSNHQLCIMSELYTIKEHFPDLSWEVLFSWATHNGAAALQMGEVIGTIEAGKKPGIIHITGLDTGNKPTVKRLF